MFKFIAGLFSSEVVADNSTIVDAEYTELWKEEVKRNDEDLLKYTAQLEAFLKEQASLPKYKVKIVLSNGLEAVQTFEAIGRVKWSDARCWMLRTRTSMQAAQQVIDNFRGHGLYQFTKEPSATIALNGVEYNRDHVVSISLIKPV